MSIVVLFVQGLLIHIFQNTLVLLNKKYDVQHPIFTPICTYFHVYFYLFLHIYAYIYLYLPQKCGILLQFTTIV